MSAPIFSVMERDAKRMRGERPFLFIKLKDGTGFPAVLDWLCAHL
jgi:urease accessory protein